MRTLDWAGRLACLVRGHKWRHVTDHQDVVLVWCLRCGAFPVWYAPTSTASRP